MKIRSSFTFDIKDSGVPKAFLKKTFSSNLVKARFFFSMLS